MSVNLVKIWEETRESLRTMLNPDLFNLWFDSIKPGALDGETIVLLVANDFCAVWLKDNYLELLQDVISHSCGSRVAVRFEIDGVSRKNQEIEPAPTSNVRPEKKTRSHRKGDAEAHSLFNPKNTFDTFVVGDNNSFAHAASSAVSQAPGKSYNPLFLYGGVGLGKTHLLHAIGHHVLLQSPRLGYRPPQCGPGRAVL